MTTLSEGQSVIVTINDNSTTRHQVAVIVKKFQHNKRTMYDVLLESRSAISAVTTATSNQCYINRDLTTKLIGSGIIETTIPYAQLVEEGGLPDTRA